MKKTQRGRVVYNRPRHFFTQRDVNRVYAHALVDDDNTREKLVVTIAQLYMIYLSEFGKISAQAVNFPWVYDEVRTRLDQMAAAVVISKGDFLIFNQFLAI